MLGGDPTVAADEMRRLLESQRAAFAQQMYPSLEVRVDRLERLRRMTERYEGAIVDAISADFGHRSAHETEMAEIFVVLSGIRHARRQLARWMKSRRVPTPMHMWPARSELVPQPLGVVGIIGPWNYPYQTAILPAVGALAAGNRVLLKPSEMAPSLADVVRAAVAEFFAPDEFAVVLGDQEVGRAFSRLPFDHLFFTGSTAVGRQIALAAAENLTPVTLELGGKSPAILDAGCDVDLAAQRIAVGKLLNAGQTCVAPDYVLLPQGCIDDFVASFSAAARKFYPSFEGNPDYTSIVNDRHYQRLQGLVADAEAKGARVLRVGNRTNPASGRWIEPTLVVGATDAMAVMREEIFGPLLPLVACETLEQAVSYVNQHPRPLALYWFGSDRMRCQRLLRATLSGGVTVNDVCWHVAQDNLPFGGVGASGMGAYHGESGFRTFSKMRPVLHQARINGFPLFRPPYGKRFETVLRLLKRIA